MPSMLTTPRCFAQSAMGVNSVAKVRYDKVRETT
jgi:hypothetical protein